MPSIIFCLFSTNSFSNFKRMVSKVFFSSRMWSNVSRSWLFSDKQLLKSILACTINKLLLATVKRCTLFLSKTRKNVRKACMFQVYFTTALLQSPITMLKVDSLAFILKQKQAIIQWLLSCLYFQCFRYISTDGQRKAPAISLREIGYFSP